LFLKTGKNGKLRGNMSLNLFKNIFFNSEQKNIRMFKNNIKEVNFELSNYCNRKCIHCPRYYVESGEIVTITDDILHKIFRNLRAINFSGRIHPHIYNEPLYDYGLLSKVISMWKKYLPEATFALATNGDFFTSEILSDLVNNCISNIYITIYYDKWDTQKQLAKVNCFLEKFKLGTVLEADQDRIIFTCHRHKTEILVRSVNFQKIGNYRGGLVKEQVVRKARSTPCSLPMWQFNMNYLGDNFPCCNIFPRRTLNDEYLMGNVLNKTIFDIYGSNQYQTFLNSVSAIHGEKSDMPDCCRLCSERR
jgi:hypothetical protein